MEVVFLSKTDIYNGNYFITKRDATHESSKEAYYHDSHEMQFYFCEPEGEKIGEITMDGKTRELIQGYTVLANMSNACQINITRKVPYMRYYISSDPSLLPFACSNAPNLFNIFSHCADVKYFQPLTPAQVATFVSIYDEHEHLTVRHGRDIMERPPILGVFAHIYDIFCDGQGISATDSRSLAVITELINYVDASAAGSLPPKRLAEHMSFSAFCLSRMFRWYIGTTLSRYIITKWIDKAELSLKGQIPITMVSKEVGFSNYNHFYRTFKSVTGINLVKYREVTEKEK